MKKIAYYGLVLMVLLLVAYNSVYIDNLQAHRDSLADEEFDAGLLIEEEVFPALHNLSTMDATIFLDSLRYDLPGFAGREGKKLGISDTYYFLVGGTAQVVSLMEEDILVELQEGGRLRIATDFIFGNTLRDASGLVDIGDYQNTMDFNEISMALNRYVKEKVLPPFNEEVQEGDTVQFKGGVKVYVRENDLSAIRLIPYSLEIN